MTALVCTDGRSACRGRGGGPVARPARGAAQRQPPPGRRGSGPWGRLGAAGSPWQQQRRGPLHPVHATERQQSRGGVGARGAAAEREHARDGPERLPASRARLVPWRESHGSGRRPAPAHQRATGALCREGADAAEQHRWQQGGSQTRHEPHSRTAGAPSTRVPCWVLAPYLRGQVRCV